MGTKIATLRTAFIKYLVMLIGGLALSVNDTLLSNCSELRVCMYTINHSFFKASTKTISAYYERDRRNFITKS